MGFTQVGNDGIKDDAITNSKIANGEINSAKMGTDSVATSAIQDQAVTLNKLPHGDSSNDGKFLRANNGADPSYETVNTDLSADSSPQLGADLDVNGKDIISTSNADIDVVPHGTGKTNFGGTKGIKLPIGDTSQRDNTTALFRFNNDTGLPEYYNGTAWISIDSPPAISSVSPTTVESDAGGNETFTISGARFSVGCTVAFISSTGVSIAASSVTRVNAGELTAVVPRSSFLNAQEPYDVSVTNPSGLASALIDQIYVDNAPAWTTPAGQIGAGFVGDSYSFTVAATDEESTVTYSLQSGSLPGGGSINNSTGVISGTHPSVGSTTLFTFTIRATAGSKFTDRQFSINSIVATVDINITSGSFTLAAAQPVKIYVIGGGGGGGTTSDGSSGGGGGGGGGMAYKSFDSLPAGTYSYTVGAKGSSTGSSGGTSGSGGTSSCTLGGVTLQATGGGGCTQTNNSTVGQGGAGGVGSGGDVNGTGGTGANGVTQAGSSQQNDGGNGTNGGAGGGGSGCDQGGSSSGRSGHGGDGSSTYYTGGGGSGGCDNDGQNISSSQIGNPGTGYTSGGLGGGINRAATAGGGNAGGAAGYRNGGNTPRNNFGGGGGSYGGGGGGAGSGDDQANPESGQGGGGAVIVIH